MSPSPEAVPDPRSATDEALLEVASESQTVSAAAAAPAQASPGFAHAWRALRHRNFRLFVAGQGISLMGTWMTRLALSWLTWRLTGSAFLLGLVAFSGQIGTALVAPFAGVWVDRLDRRRLLVITQILSGAQSLTLAALTLSHHITIHEVIALAAIQGLVDAFDMPARQSFAIRMVDGNKQDLGNAIALNSSMVNAARLVGPAAAGLLITRLGEGWCFLLDGLSYLAVIASLLSMRLAADQRPAGSRPPVAQQMHEGWQYVSGFLPVRTILLLFAAVCLCGPAALSLLPLFASRTLGGGAHTLALLSASNGAGALVAAALLAARRSVRGLTRTIGSAALLSGAGIVLFGMSHHLALSLAALTLAGFGFIQVMSAANTVLQTVIPEERRGRVMAWFVLAFAGSVPVGSLLMGALAHALSAPYAVMLAGCAILLAALWYRLRLPALRRELRPVYINLGLMERVRP